jgi:hypothetical protein
VVRVIPGNLISNKIDVGFLQPGIYFLKIDLPGKPVVLKFIKK